MASSQARLLCGIIVTARVTLSAAVVTLSSYLMLDGSVAAAVSSVDPDADLKQVDSRTAAKVREIVERGDAASL